MKKKVLVVEDEPSIAYNIEYALKQEDFVSTWVTTCAQAAQIVKDDCPSLVILDIGLPDGSGFDLCRQIRKTSSVPIIMLTARADEVDRIVGLEIGADDYVVKPFSPRELATRVKTILRRTEAVPPVQGTVPKIRYGPFQIDDERVVISYFDTEVPLSRYEFRILKVLIGHPGWVYSREKLMLAVWEDPDMSTERTVDSHIKSLRAKLREIRPDIDPIRTHRGLGYSLIDTWQL